MKKSVDQNNSVEYLYDASGERTAKKSDRGESLFFDSMWSVTTDYPDFRQSKHIYVGSTRIATRLNIEGDASTGYERLNTYYYHTDHLGSAQVITDFEGQQYEHIEYAPWGEMWVEEKSDSFDKIPFRFTGQEWDEETKLSYHSARYYDPRVSRWMSADPLGSVLANPGSGKFSMMEGTNFYGYCKNNPVNYVDPTGEVAWFVVLAIVAVVAMKGCDYGMTAWDIKESAQTMADPKADYGDKVLAAVNIGLAVAFEALEPDDLTPVAVPLDDIGRKAAMKAIKKLYKEGGMEAVEKYLRKEFGDKADDILKIIRGKIDDVDLIPYAKSLGAAGNNAYNKLVKIGNSALGATGKQASTILQKLARKSGLSVVPGGKHLKVLDKAGNLVTTIPHSPHSKGTIKSIVEAILRVAEY